MRTSVKLSSVLSDIAWCCATVVTGATAGIGRDFAIQLAGAGFNVFLASRTTSKLEEISKEISKSPDGNDNSWSRLLRFRSRLCRTVQPTNTPTSRPRYMLLTLLAHPRPTTKSSELLCRNSTLVFSVSRVRLALQSTTLLTIPYNTPVNNVGKSYDEPAFYQDLPDQDIADIVEINV